MGSFNAHAISRHLIPCSRKGSVQFHTPIISLHFPTVIFDSYYLYFVYRIILKSIFKPLNFISIDLSHVPISPFQPYPSNLPFFFQKYFLDSVSYSFITNLLVLFVAILSSCFIYRLILTGKE